VAVRVVVSGAPADRALAEQISSALAGGGLDVWFDAGPGGDEGWWQRSTDAVRAADVFVTAWTSNLVSAKAGTALLHYAGALGKPVVAVRSGPVEHAPATYGLPLQWVDFGDPALAGTVGALAAAAGPPPSAPAPAPPWPFAYLTSLRAEVAAPALSADQQQQMVSRLQTAAAEDGSYPAVRDGVAELVAALRTRPDLDPEVRGRLDAFAPAPPGYPEPQPQWAPTYPTQGYPPQAYPSPGYAPYPPPSGYPPPGYPPYPAPSTHGRTIAILGAVAVVVVIALVAGILVLMRSGDDEPVAAPPSGSDTATESAEPDTDDPVVRLVDDGILVGSRTAPVTIDVFNDAMCPPCGQFITTYGTQLRDRLLDSSIRVHYHLVNMLDSLSASGDYSSRAAAAVYCVAADADVATLEEFYAELFDPGFQPEEGGSADHTDDELADLSVQAGASVSAASCIASGENSAEAAQRTEEAMDTLTGLGAQGVPVVFEGRQEVNIQDPGWVDALTG
jgi:protein-disulfide isomerase